MNIGTLDFQPIANQLKLVAEPVRLAVTAGIIGEGVFVAPVDESLSDTMACIEAYNLPRDIATNCIVIEAKRADRTWYAACLVLADDLIDVNNKVRRFLDARKISFAPQAIALELTHMEYGGVTPFGLPDEWPILIDEKVGANDYAVLGAGVRSAKILATTAALTALPNTTVLDITKDL